MPALEPRCEYYKWLLYAALLLTITYYIYMQLVESLRTAVSRAHLGHRKDTQHNKHCEEMLGIHHFDKQLWFIPQPFRVKADHRGIIPSLLLNSLLHSQPINGST